jgi:hypothetical protein
MQYSGESSAQSFDFSSVQGTNLNPWFIDIDAAAYGNAGYPYLNPSGIGVDISRMTEVDKGSFRWRNAGLVGKLKIRDYCGSGGTKVDLEGIWPYQLDWSTSYLSGCQNWQGGWLTMHHDYGGKWLVRQDIQLSSTALPASDLQNDTFFENVTGSVLVKSPIPPGQPNGTAIGGSVVGTPGSTTYHYAVTCSDGQGNETAASAMTAGGALLNLSFNNGPVTLNTTNYLTISFRPHRGCAFYTLYGDNGVGGAIGKLVTTRSTDLIAFPAPIPNGVGWADQGQWTKQAQTAPTTSSSGILEVENGITIDSLKSAACIGTDANGKIVSASCSGTGGSGTVTNVSASVGGNFNPFMSVTVATPTTTPAITINPASNVQPNSIWGRAVTGAGFASWLTVPDCSATGQALNWTIGTGFTCQTIGAGAGNIITSGAMTGSRTGGTAAIFIAPGSMTGGVGSGGEPAARVSMPRAGNVGMCYARAEAGTAAGSWTFQLMNEGVNCGSSIVLSGTAPAVANTNVGCSFSAGNGLSWTFTPTGTPPNTFIAVSCAVQ